MASSLDLERTKDDHTNMKSKVTCAVIGEGNLLLTCLKDIQNNGITINAVFTNTTCAETLCADNGTLCYRRNVDLVDVLNDTGIDYLFSISNPRILKEDVLKVPRKMTINYHDSPLPKYAGISATSWAIMSGERHHGISWHKVEIGIDTGDILQSEQVDILEDDSALTLNLKCIEAAKVAFRRLIDDIVHDTIKSKKQPDTGRTYFGLYAIPPNAGIMKFNKNAEEIYNLARSLEFGNHENALGSPKIKTSTGDFFLVTNVSRSDQLIINNTTDAGTILDTVDDTLIVATETSSIEISVASLHGSPISKCQFREHGLVKEDKLDISLEIDIEALVPFRKKEGYWRRKMLNYEPTTFYRQKMNVVANIIDVSTEITMKSERLKIPILELGKNMYSEEFLQACFIAFLARITCTPSVSVGILTGKSDIPPECKDIYATVTPGVFKIEHSASVTEVFESITKDLTIHKDSKTFLVDMFYRYPELRGHKRSPHHNLVFGSKDQYDKLDQKHVKSVLLDCNLLLLFSRDSYEIEVLYHERPAQDFSHVVDLLRHFTTFLNAVNDCKDQPNELRRVSLVSKNEINRFYITPPTAHEDVYKNERLAELVKRQCQLTPLSIAIKTTRHVMTYRKLLEETNSLSSLIEEIVPSKNGTKAIVALHMPNSVSYVISLLALIERDVAFLPIPIDSPAERILFTLKDAKIERMIMTKNTFNDCDRNGLAAKMKNVLQHKIADEELVMVEFEKHNYDVKVNGNACRQDFFEEHCKTTEDNDFIYVMYTSGSTGRPKGVKIKESSLINLARAQIMCWDIQPGDVTAQFASIGFDATMSEIFTSLLSGGSLAMLDSTQRHGSSFTMAIGKMKVSVITLPPSALNIYSPTDLPSLRKVVTAGEACTLNTAVKWTSAMNIRFFNAYGPTEGTVCATCFEYYPGNRYEDVNRDLPIGKAIDGVQVYLFDDFMNPLPPDVIGEIYIGGKGLAHGYIGHASHFTKERFVQSPIVEEESLLYKTGDHAFYDNDGFLTYVGRLDNQVKIRGHRIDLNEIEQVLIQHPKVEMAIVVVHKCNQSKDLSIAAFIAPTFIYISELREYLSKVLPGYLIPNHIKKMEITDLPKTLNGKVNRKELEQDESIHEILGVDGHSHLNETQLYVARQWCTVFKFDESFVYSLHRQSSFSELGGNSLQLVLLLRLIEDELNTDISFTDLGTADTIEEFAEVIRRRKDIKRKCKQTDIKSKEELRELIFQDSELDSSYFPHPERRRSVQFSHYTTLVHKHTTRNKHPKNILLSGVTGFLGAFLLSEVLEQTTSHVCCMVRETTEPRGVGRIIDNMRKYGLWKFEYTSRIAVVISDLSQKNLGIAPDIYKSLCNAIDVVFMNAAMMNFNTTYEDHRIANVESTREFIKFASTGVQKYIYTTSSLAVFLFPPSDTGSKKQRRMCYESEFFDDPLLLEGGYGQSKWASERLVMQALDFLPGGAIFRPARVSGRSSDGVGPKNDLFASTMIGMKRIGSYPEIDFPYDLTPVDFCAKSMIEVALKIYQAKPNTCEKVYHLFNSDTIPFKDLFDGMGLKGIPLDEWRHVLQRADDTNKELIPLTPFFKSSFWDRASEWPVFDTSNLDNAISSDAKELRKPTKQLLETYMTFFQI